MRPGSLSRLSVIAFSLVMFYYAVSLAMEPEPIQAAIASTWVGWPTKAVTQMMHSEHVLPRMRRGFGTVLVTALLAGCASAGTPSGAGGSAVASAVTGMPTPVLSTGPPSVRSSAGTSVSAPPGAGSRQVGLGANGSTIVLRVRQQLELTLAPNWTPPRAGIRAPGVMSALQPLLMIASVGFPAAGTAAATFTAIRTGTAVVTASTDYACLHTTPRCLPPQQLFTLTVTVLPRLGGGAGPLPKPGTP